MSLQGPPGDLPLPLRAVLRLFGEIQRPGPPDGPFPPRPASRGPCVDMLEMGGSETTPLGIGQAALSLPAASEALLKPPMWTCVNFLSESYISRGGGSL